MSGKPQPISAEEAHRLCRGFAPLAAEEIALADAAGRVLAGDFAAPAPLPAWARGVMDGFAVRAADTSGATGDTPRALRLAGSVPIGGEYAGEVGAGEAVAIATGGVLPRGADCVVMVEHARAIAGTGSVEILRAADPGQHVMQPGEDLAAGEPLLPAGRRLRAPDLAALASFGVTSLRVHRRPRVAVLSTGSEVVPPTATPRVGQVRDANQAALAAQARAAGCDVTLAGIAADDAAALTARLAELLAAHDALLVSGGSSVGVRDLTADALDAIGAETLFHGIAIRPGRPTMLARAGDKPVVGLPGVPAAALIIFDLFIAPLLRTLGGERLPPGPVWPAQRTARLARRVASAPGREEYLRVSLREAPDGTLLAEPIPGGAANLSTLVRADGLLVVPAAAAALDEGSPALILLYT